jgi:hypothetical protein
MDEMDWIVQQNPIDETLEPIDTREINFMNLVSEVKYIEEISPLVQFILLPAALDKNMVTTIPTSDFDLYEECMDKISPFFSSVKGIVTNATPYPNKIQFRHILESPKEKIIKMISENTLHPIVSDLYGDLTTSRPEGVINVTKSYKLVPEKIGMYDDLGFEEAWEFLMRTYIKNYHVLSIVPTNWYLTDELKNSAALKFFNSVSDDVYLFVDHPTKRVIGIDIFE